MCLCSVRACPLQQSASSDEIIWDGRPTDASDDHTTESTSTIASISSIQFEVDALPPPRCFLDLVEAMRRDVRGLATMHIVTDLSLWAPAEASIDALRSHAHSHEAALRRALHHQGVHPFAFTVAVADFLHAWPSLQWPAPGEPLFPMSAYDGPTRSWLLFLERTLQEVHDERRGVLHSRDAARTALAEAVCGAAWSAGFGQWALVAIFTSSADGDLIHAPSSSSAALSASSGLAGGLGGCGNNKAASRLRAPLMCRILRLARAAGELVGCRGGERQEQGRMRARWARGRAGAPREAASGQGAGEMTRRAPRRSGTARVIPREPSQFGRGRNDSACESTRVDAGRFGGRVVLGTSNSSHEPRRRGTSRVGTAYSKQLSALRDGALSPQP